MMIALCFLRGRNFETSLFNKLLRYNTCQARTVRRLSTMETIKQTIAQNFGGASHNLADKEQQFTLDQIPSLDGKVAVVTGGSEGIGYGCTHSLLSHGIKKIFIVSVSKEVVDGAVSAIKEEMGDEAAEKVSWLQCDLSDWKKTKETADKIASSTDRIDILINNAARGIMTYQLTEYGVDRHVRSYSWKLFCSYFS